MKQMFKMAMKKTGLTFWKISISSHTLFYDLLGLIWGRQMVKMVKFMNFCLQMVKMVKMSMCLYNYFPVLTERVIKPVSQECRGKLLILPKKTRGHWTQGLLFSFEVLDVQDFIKGFDRKRKEKKNENL